MTSEERPRLYTSTTFSLNAEKEFILTYEALPVLWDRSNLHYANKFKRNEALEKLLVIYKKLRPDAGLDDVRRKINSLRSNYRRELKKVVLSKSSGGKEYVPKSWIFDLLHFLNKFEQPVTEIHESQDSLDIDPLSEPDECEEEAEEQKVVVENIEPRLENQPVTIKIEQIEKEHQSFISSLSHEDPEDIPPMKKHIRKYQSPRSNEISSWSETPKLNTLAIYWTEKLEKLTTTQRIYAEKAINDVLLEAELGTLDKNSVKINIPEQSTSKPESSS